LNKFNDMDAGEARRSEYKRESRLIAARLNRGRNRRATARAQWLPERIALRRFN